MYKSTTVKQLPFYLSAVTGVIFALVPFHAFLTVWLSSLVGHYTLLRLWKEFLLVILVAGCFVLLVKDTKLRNGFLRSRLTQLIILYCILSVIWGAVAYGQDKVTAKALGYGLIVNLRFPIFFLTTWLIATKSRFLDKNWQKLIIIPAVLVLAVGLIQRLFLPYDVLKHFGYNDNTIFPYETINHNVHYPRIMSTLRGANPLGAYLVVIISIGAALLLKARRKWRLGLFVLAALACLFLSYSRGAWLGMALSFLALGWLGIKKAKTQKLAAAVLAGLLIIGAGLAVALRHNVTFENYFLHTQSNSTAKISSNQGHVSAFKNGVHDIVHEPLGQGVGTAGPASAYNGTKGRIAENYYIQIGQELGWIGLIVFLAINYLAAQELWHRRSDTLSLALLVSFIGLIAVSFFSHGWTDDTLAYIWWGLAGVALATAHRKTQAL